MAPDSPVSWDQDWQAAQAVLAALPAGLRGAAMALAIPMRVDAAVLAAILGVSEAEAGALLPQLAKHKVFDRAGKAAGNWRLSAKLRRGLLSAVQMQTSHFSPWHRAAQLHFEKNPFTENRIAALYHEIAAAPETPASRLAAEAGALSEAQDFPALQLLFAALADLRAIGLLTPELQFEEWRLRAAAAGLLAQLLGPARAPPPARDQLLHMQELICGHGRPVEADEDAADDSRPGVLGRRLELMLWHDWLHAAAALGDEFLGLARAHVAEQLRRLGKVPDAGLAFAAGEIWSAINEPEAACEAYGAAAAQNPGFGLALARRGEVLRQLGRNAEALADLTAALERMPGDSWTLASRGAVLRVLRRHEEALADLNLALAVTPDYAWALSERAAVMQDLQRPEAALADFNKSLALMPRNVWALHRRAEVLRGLGRNEEVLADLTRALALAPRHVVILAERGDLYRLLGDDEAALADVNLAIEIDPDYPWAIATRGEILRTQGRLSEAMADFDRALALLPDDQWVLARRAQAVEAMKGREEEGRGAEGFEA